MAEADLSPVASSCKEAKALGLRRYFTGKPCVRGHVAERAAHNQACVVCANENSKKWQAKHIEPPERVAARAAGLKRYDTGAPCQNGHVALRYVHSGNCVECDRAKRKRWMVVRPGVEAAWARKRRAADPTGHRAEVKRWVQKRKQTHPELTKDVARALTAAYRSRKAANGGKFTAADIAALYRKQNGKCANCHTPEPRMEVDHINPTRLGGSSDPSNLQLLCRHCNRTKSGKDPVLWAQSQGRLL